MLHINKIVRGRIIASVLILLFVSCNRLSAQDANTTSVHEAMEQGAPSTYEDSLFEFFFYVQERYYSGHLMYCNDLKKMIQYGERMFPYLYQRVLENIDDFKEEHNKLELQIFYKDTFLASYNHPLDPKEYSTYIFLRNFVTLFDEDDFSVTDSNIYNDYLSLRRSITIKLHEQSGCEVEMQKVSSFEEEDTVTNMYPLTVVFVYDSSGLHLHPLFDDYEDLCISEKFKQMVVQMAASLCSKYKAEKIIFSVPVMRC